MAVVAASRRVRRAAPAAAPGISLIIPAWNERESIGQAIEEAVSALAGLTLQFEVIVVDDGSHDDTAAHVLAETAADARVRLVRHGRNRGYGAALRSGFTAASYERVAFTDADCQFDLRDLARLLPLAERHDLVCGYRLHRQDSARRRFLSWGYNRLVGLLLGLPLRDIDCALKVFRREALLRILPHTEGFFANTEMMVSAQRLGLSLAEIGVPHRPRLGGHSKVRWSDVPRTLATLLPFWWRHTSKRSPRAIRDLAGASRG